MNGSWPVLKLGFSSVCHKNTSSFFSARKSEMENTKTSEHASVTASTVHATLDRTLYNRSLVLRFSLRSATHNFWEERDCSQSNHRRKKELKKKMAGLIRHLSGNWTSHTRSAYIAYKGF